MRPRSLTIPDARGSGAYLRVTRHPEQRKVVISHWRDDVCVASTPVELVEVPSHRRAGRRHRRRCPFQRSLAGDHGRHSIPGPDQGVVETSLGACHRASGHSQGQSRQRANGLSTDNHLSARESARIRVTDARSRRGARTGEGRSAWPTPGRGHVWIGPASSVRSSRDTDDVNAEEYAAVRARITVIVSEGDPERPVPGCPGWRVRDVVAHLAGLCEDWVDHRLDGYASERWTDAQISRSSGESLEEVLERWRSAAERFAQLEDDPTLGPPARWAFGDAITHEADIRGALQAGRVPPDAVLLSVKGSVARWRETSARCIRPDAPSPSTRRPRLVAGGS